MKMFLIVFLTALGIAGTCHAANFTDLELFTVTNGTTTIDYKAHVNQDDCSFDQKNPTDVFLIEKNVEHKVSWLESHYVAFDYLMKALKTVVGEVKFLKNNNIHWPVTLVVQKDAHGQCQGAAVGTEIGEVIKNVAITQTDQNDVPTEMVVDGFVNGQAVQTPVNLN